MKTSESDPRAGEAGVTLLELLFVLSLLGVMFASVGIIARSGGQEMTLDGAGLAVASLMRGAKASAIGTGEVVRVEIDLEAGHVAAGPSGDRVQLGDAIRLAGEFAAEASTGSNPGILFFPDGTTTGGELALLRDEWERVVTVHWLTGRVDVE